MDIKQFADARIALAHAQAAARALVVPLDIQASLNDAHTALGELHAAAVVLSNPDATLAERNAAHDRLHAVIGYVSHRPAGIPPGAIPLSAMMPSRTSVQPAQAPRAASVASVPVPTATKPVAGVLAGFTLDALGAGRLMASRFAGRCIECGERMEVGTLIRHYGKGNGSAHDLCHSAELSRRGVGPKGLAALYAAPAGIVSAGGTGQPIDPNAAAQLAADEDSDEPF